MYFILACFIILITNVNSEIEATFSVFHRLNHTRTDIPDNSVFVGEVTGYGYEFGCHGNEDWSVCNWINIEDNNIKNTCQYITNDEFLDDGCVDRAGKDMGIRIEREGTDCILVVTGYFNETNIEGSWKCSLSKIMS